MILAGLAGHPGAHRVDRVGGRRRAEARQRRLQHAVEDRGRRQVALLGLDLVQHAQVPERRQLTRADQRQRGALLARAAGAAGAVDVDLGRVGEAEVDDVRQLGDVDAARGDVGGDQELEVLVAHALHHALAIRLRQIRRQRLGVDALLLQEARDRAGFVAGVAEDDRAVGLLLDDHLQQIAGAGDAAHDVVAVVDVLDGDVAVGQRDALRRLHVALGVALDLVGHRRREQQRLAALRDVRRDALDVLEEAHRQHLVALVEHEEADGLQRQRLAADVIEDAARGADHDVHAGAQLLDLLADGRAAVDRDDRQALVLAERRHLAADLQRELAGRREHDRLGHLVGGVDRADDRQAERGGLAGAGARLDQQVLAGDHGGVDRGLDRSRVEVAHVVEGGLDITRQVEIGERERGRCGGRFLAGLGGLGRDERG